MLFYIVVSNNLLLLVLMCGLFVFSQVLYIMAAGLYLEPLMSCTNLGNWYSFYYCTHAQHISCMT